jgi:hypothetical protein
MKGAGFTIPTPALLAEVVDLRDAIPREDRNTKGDLTNSCWRRSPPPARTASSVRRATSSR